MSQHEPERFAKTYIEIPSMPLRSEDDKLQFLAQSCIATGVRSLDPYNIDFDLKKTKADELRDFVAREVAKSGSQVLDSESLHTLRSMAKSLNIPQHAEPRSIVARGAKELEIRWTDSISGIECKSRIDSWDESLGILSDLKRTAAITRSAFRREVLNRDYHYQLAFYRRALRSRGEEPKYSCFVCGCPTGPIFPWAIYDLPEEVLDACDAKITCQLIDLAECVNKNNWPSLNGGRAATLDINPDYV
jgi:hypothetical protein